MAVLKSLTAALSLCLWRRGARAQEAGRRVAARYEHARAEDARVARADPRRVDCGPRGEGGGSGGRGGGGGG